MGDLPSTRTRVLHVFTLSAFAVAQPLFDLLGRNASFFVAHRAERIDVILLTAAAMLVVPTVLAVLGSIAARISPRAGHVVHLATVGILLGIAVCAPLARVLGATWIVAALIFVCVGGVAALVYARAAVMRRFVTVLTPVLLVFPALFVFGPQVRAVTSAPAAVSRVSAAESDVPVVTVLFDELSLSSIIRPDGRIDEDRFPNFARLAETSTWYRNTTTSGLRTDQAVPAILTGRRVPERQVPSSFAYPDNAFTLMAPTHRLHVHEFVTQLCPAELCPVSGHQVSGRRALFSDAAIVYGHIVLPDDLAERWLPPLGDRWAGFSRDAGGGGGGGDPVSSWLRAAIDERETQHEGAVFERFLREIVPTKDKPTFSWLHAQLPHPPWRYLPDGTTYPTGSNTPGYRNFRWSDNQYLADEVLQRSLLQARFADVLLGRLLDHLERTEQLDDTMLNVIADHGATWERDSTRREVDGPQGGALLGVPLFVKYPEQHTGRVDKRNAETVDLLPTIAKITGVEMPWEPHGLSLLQEGNGHRSRRVFDGEQERAVRYTFDDSISMAEHISDLFGPGGGKDDLYAFGPHRDLLGTRGDELPEVGATFDTSPYDDMETEAGELPVLFRATMHAAVAVPVAVVVNGRVAGVGQTYVEDDSTRMAIMLTPRYFKEGRNDVRVVEIA